MNVEIERKFLVKSEAWRGLAEGVRFRQGYLQQAFERPGWIGEEVTGDRRYANSALASRPFCTW
jgi:CYTH domain-containing protein